MECHDSLYAKNLTLTLLETKKPSATESVRDMSGNQFYFTHKKIILLQQLIVGKLAYLGLAFFTEMSFLPYIVKEITPNTSN